MAGGRKGGRKVARSGGGAAGGRQDLSPSQLEATLPEYGGNSRVFNARRELAAGGLKDQASLLQHDMEGHLQQLAGLNSRSIKAMERNGDLVFGRDGSTRRPVSEADTRKFTAQANRDLRTIYRRADSGTKNSWAEQLGGSFTGARNPTVRAIAKDLSRRNDLIQQQKEAERRAARAARRAAQQAN